MTFGNSDEATDGIIRADRRGRLLVRAEQRTAILKAFDDSSLSAMAFCRQHGLAYSTFATWIQKKRRQAEGPARDGPPVQKQVFAEVLVEEKRAVVASCAPLRIVLRSGVSFEVSSSGQIPLVAELIQSLSTQRPC